MSSEQAIERLKAARLLRTPEEVASFDSALTSVPLHHLGVDELAELHLVLDDATHDFEVMFGLVHLLEDAAVISQISALLRVLPELAKRAPEWSKILHFRILNDAEARGVYRDLLLNTEGESFDAAKALLLEIAATEEKPLADLALEVLPPR